MKNKRREDTEILPSKNQLSLFGYTNYFNSMVELFKKKELPNCILFSGPKGLGKSTFVYHFVNYSAMSRVRMLSRFSMISGLR